MGFASQNLLCDEDMKQRGVVIQKRNILKKEITEG